jgi:hypothetical protein
MDDKLTPANPKDIADTITFWLGSRAGTASMRRTSTWATVAARRVVRAFGACRLCRDEAAAAWRALDIMRDVGDGWRTDGLCCALQPYGQRSAYHGARQNERRTRLCR